MTDRPRRQGISRRLFLRRSGLVAGSVLFAGALPGDELPGLRPVDVEAFPEMVDLVRPDDQLMIQAFWIAYQFSLELADGRYFLTAGTAPDIAVSVYLQTQHVMEWAVDPPANPSRPVHSRDTELRFHVPAGYRIEQSVEGWLTLMRELPLVTHTLSGEVAKVDRPTAHSALVPAAELLSSATANAAELARRSAALTALPVPNAYTERAMATTGVLPEWATELNVSSRLAFSPPGGATRFTHAVAPVRRDGPYTEIWGTRLTVRTLDGGRIEMPLNARAVRVAIGEGGGGTYENDTGVNLNALTRDQAQKILDQNGQVDEEDPDGSAIRMPYLLLSPRLGATTRLGGNWEDAAVESFKHRVRTGRDVSSRIEVAGRLYPFGHRVVQTTTTARVFNSNGVAPLRRSSVITVEQAVKPYGQRLWPFTSIELLVDETPEGSLQPLPNAPSSLTARYLEVNGEPYEFECRGVDHAGRRVRFSLPLIYVPKGFTQYSTLAGLWAGWTGPLGRKYANVALGHLTVAPPLPQAGDSDPGEERALGATEVVVSTAVIAGSDTASYTPGMSSFTGRLPALGHLSDQTQEMTVTYASWYQSYGFGDGNPGEVVLALGSSVPVDLTDGKGAGGLVSGMSTVLTAMSRKLGAVAGTQLEQLAGGWFDPAQFLGSALGSMTLFDIFPLAQLLPGVTAFKDAPRITAATIDGLRTQTFRWVVPLYPENTAPVPGAILRRRGNQQPYLTIESVVSAGPDGQPHQHTRCQITNLEVGLGLGAAELITLPLGAIAFESVDAQKPSVDVDLGQIEFHGVLGFVRRLAELIGGGGFGSGSTPALDVTPDGVRSSFSLAIPSVAVGMFSLENITLGAALDLRFTDPPRLAFNFATYDNPFRVTVSALGGGGYLALGMSAGTGLDTVEGALEFGAQIRIDLKVAAGKVSAMGGIYFKIENGDTTLTGYFTIQGEVTVLAIVTCGVRETLSLTYSGGKVRGEAELCFYVSTFFFHKTVRKTFSRTFAGSNGDPTFAQLMAPEGSTAGARPWDAYCKAFG